MPPLVTVVTATWGRPRTIFEHAIASVGAQDYPEIEHLIVTDGRDPDLEGALQAAGYTHGGTRKRLASLGRNWTGYSGDGGVGAVPRLVGAWMAAGDYIAYLDDDNDYLPHHLSRLVAAAEDGNDLVCTVFRHGHAVMGAGIPGPGNVDTSSFLHHASLLKISAWQTDGYEGDGQLVARWIAAGVQWTVLGEPTMILNSHRFGAPDDPQ